MKKIITSLAAVALLCSACSSFQEIGKLNMLSNRNVDPKLNYKVLTTYSGGSDKELKKSRAESIEAATDQTVKRIAGGEFLMNAKIYLVKGKYFAVEGDVWGSPAAEAASFRGLKVGDKVTWKSLYKYHKGTITALKGDKTCLVENEDGKTVELKYNEVTKL